MVPSTRRTLLHSVCGLATVLSGCSGVFEGSDESTRTASKNNGSSASGAGSVSDPDAVVTRVDADRQPVWLADGDGRPTESPHSRRLESKIIDTASQADQVTVAEDADRPLIRTFLDETDFDTETVYVQNMMTEECFRLTLCQIRWTSDNISTDYGRVSRPYDASCTAGNKVYAVWFIRIPDTVNADDISSYSSSIGGNSCERQRAGAAGESEGGSGAVPSSDRRTRSEGEQA
ncbi:hypothetical protein ACODNH_22140 [Haloarcula sp. NS06]|uniref:hypothetical protein n=1 Tax=unclassified Haloarcula TaxID=2624677 RepID=UPI0027AE6C4C|nr:hypothetical protein [Haloarcula sp. H-GB4]MDQ2074378.1 hypothetical protein [Haloarcula sp. H-GB4]